MKHILRTLFFVSFICLIRPLQAQTLTVSSPIEGAVYQRNAQDQGKIIVQGDLNSLSFSQGSYTATASLRKLSLDNGAPTGDAPITITLTQQGTIFTGERTVAKGWYELTVRAEPGSGNPCNKPIYENKRKVGVGEVFIIAGQSNAQGLNGMMAPSTQLLDAVRVSPDQIPDFEKEDPTRLRESYRRISRMVSVKEAGKIGPLGNSLWYWAAVGAKVAQACQVPVAFLNSAYYGTTITNWATSTDPKARTSGFGQSADNTVESRGFQRYRPGAPFHFFSSLFQVYASTYGLRAVLWMQGETDTKAAQEKEPSWADRILYDEALTTPLAPLPLGSGNGNAEKRYIRNASEYQQKFKWVIEKTRQLLPNHPVPWVVARTSYIEGNASASVIGGQNAVLTSSGLSQIYAGPETDVFGPAYRRTGGGEPTHFNELGLDSVAARWARPIISLCTNPGSGLVTVQDLGTEPRSLRIADNGKTVEAPAGFSSYTWGRDFDVFDGDAPVRASATFTSQASDPQQTGFLKGKYRALLRNREGNYVLTQSINYPYVIMNDTGGCTPVSTMGHVDGANCDAVSGWSFTSGGGYSNLDIYINNQKVATITANQTNRADVRAAFGNDAGIPINCGFLWQIPAQYKTGQPLTILVRPTGSTTAQLGGSNPTTTAACPGTSTPPPPTPEPPTPQPPTTTPVPTTGHVDGANCDAVSGWAFKNGGGYVDLDIYINNQKAATIKSNQVSRADVRAAFGNDAGIPIDCGFLWQIPAQYKTGQPITIVVRPAGNTSAQLGGSNPMTTAACPGTSTPPTPQPPTPQPPTPQPPTPEPPTPQPPTTPSCNFTHGQYLLTTSWGEAIYAHVHNGILFAALQGGQSFKPPHWLQAVGFAQYACFAASDPRARRAAAGASVEMPFAADELSVSPNPSNGRFTVQFFAPRNQKMTVRVVDLMSHLLWKQELTGDGTYHKQEIQLGESVTGVVLVQVQTETDSGTRRVIIVR
ncbi:sialate O-acetylesterase [Tellurirhabdus bombi]|uniref:sialate O-acetylesterase n=1 Tax=Tellurirhabdus bombi TaxID=2907205 RepID=UPI001F20BFF8|nr:sialate O-acetylesterase [Tellurirhabdus bombi]